MLYYIMYVYIYIYIHTYIYTYMYIYIYISALDGAGTAARQPRQAAGGPNSPRKYTTGMAARPAAPRPSAPDRAVHG